MWSNPHFPADLVTFTEEFLSGEIQFLCSVNTSKGAWLNVETKLRPKNKPRIQGELN